MAAARDNLFPKVFAKTTKSGAPIVGLIVSSLLITGLTMMNYNASLVDQFTFVILLATLTTLIPYVFSAAAQLMLLVTDRARFDAKHLAAHATAELRLPDDLDAAIAEVIEVEQKKMNG